MRLQIAHDFPVSVARLARAANSDEFQARLTALPRVAERRVTTQRRARDGSIHRVVRYRFGADLPAAVTAMIGDTITWDEVGDWEPKAREWRIEIVPDVFRQGFQAIGTYRFTGGTRSGRREVSIDLVVKVPLVGGKVEKAIGDGLVEVLDAEAAMLAEYLR